MKYLTLLIALSATSAAFSQVGTGGGGTGTNPGNGWAKTTDKSFDPVFIEVTVEVTGIPGSQQLKTFNSFSYCSGSSNGSAPWSLAFSSLWAPLPSHTWRHDIWTLIPESGTTTFDMVIEYANTASSESREGWTFDTSPEELRALGYKIYHFDLGTEFGG